MNLANIGTAIGSRLENVEYLSLNFYRARSCTVFGIHQLINGISSKGNTLKSLRIRIIKHRYLSNESARDLVRGIRMHLVNLEELCVVLAGNLWLTPSGVKALRDDERRIEGLELRIKKYEIRHHWMNSVSLVIDDATKDMSRYIRGKFAEVNVKEGILVSNEIFVWLKMVVFSRVVNNKVVIGATDSGE